MSGLVGIYKFKQGERVDETVLRKMCDIIKHRGPDEEGIYIDGNIGFGIRRLATIDLTSGNQPIHNEDKTIWVICDGNICNFIELQERLQSKHRFYTKTDAETIVHLYEDYGINCLKYLRGAFAFALWDGNEKKLFIARDRLGEKPLVYTIQNSSLIFASEMKGILALENVKATINLEAIHLFLTYQYIPSPMTIYQEIKRLPSATYLVCNEKGNIETKKYWGLDFTEKTKVSFDEAKREIKNILIEATKMRLTSDVPIGAFLSGGHDSSIIVGLMSMNLSKPVKTFTLGFEEKEFSELKYARKIAAQFNTEHHEFILKPNSIELLPKIIWHYDQPFADPSALPTYYISKMANGHVKVALNGDGGDENFAGYLRYKALISSMYFASMVQLFGKKPVMGLTSIIPHSVPCFSQIHRLISALHEPFKRRNSLWHCFFDNETKSEIYSDKMLKRFLNDDAFRYIENKFETAPANDIMDRVLYTDINTYLPECLTVKVDIASMANSIETRAPFLDHKLFEFTAKLPFRWKLHGLTTKYILKETFKGFLPKEITKRGKRGFGIPLREWLKNEWKSYFVEVVLSKRAIERNYFRKETIKEMLNEHLSDKRNHGYRLWALLILELWHRIYIDKEKLF